MNWRWTEVKGLSLLSLTRWQVWNKSKFKQMMTNWGVQQISAYPLCRFLTMILMGHFLWATSKVQQKQCGANAHSFSAWPFNNNLALILFFFVFLTFSSIYDNKWDRNEEKKHLSERFPLSVSSFSLCLSCSLNLSLSLLASRFVSWTSGGRWAKKGNRTVWPSALFSFNRPGIPGGAGRSSPWCHISAAGSGLRAGLPSLAHI